MISVKAASAFTAGLFLNAALIRFAGWQYPLIADPARTAAGLALHSAFLALAVFYVPACLRASLGLGLRETCEWCLGERAAAVLHWVVIPLWAIAWASLSAATAGALLRFGFTRKHWNESADAYTLLIPLILLVMIAPWATRPIEQLAPDSLFCAKVAAAAVAGLVLSTIDSVPETYAVFQSSRPAEALQSTAVFWAAPPLLLLTGLIGPDRRTLTRFAILGIVLPSIAAVAAGLSTMAGAAQLSHSFLKVPDHLDFVCAWGNRVGWVKALAVAFTLLTACRFGVHALARTFSPAPNLALGAVSCAVLLAGQWLVSIDALLWGWQYAAAPFVTLAGIFCAAWATRSHGAFSLGERHTAIVAWAAGTALIVVPPAAEGVMPAYFSLPVIMGWLAAFVITGAARVWLRRTS